MIKGDLYVELANIFYKKNAEKFEEYLNQAKAISTYSTDEKKSKKLDYHYALLDDFTGKYDAAKLKYEAILKKTADSTYLFESHIKIADLLRKEGKYEEAIEYVIAGKEIEKAKAESDVMRDASANVMLGIIYKQLKQYPKAVEY